MTKIANENSIRNVGISAKCRDIAVFFIEPNRTTPDTLACFRYHRLHAGGALTGQLRATARVAEFSTGFKPVEATINVNQKGEAPAEP